MSRYHFQNCYINATVYPLRPPISLAGAENYDNLFSEIYSIETKTAADDPNSGSNAKVDVLIECGSRTCKAHLDNPSVDNFALGAVNTFSGDTIGDCDGFKCDQQLKTTLIHYGTDGWKCDYMKQVP